MTSRRARALASSPFAARRVPPAPPEQFEVGQRVTHDRHGMGRVVELEGNVAVIADFGDRLVRVTLASGRLQAL